MATQNKQESVVVLTNLPDQESAHSLAREMVELRLAACVNILPGVQSIYQWQGAVESTAEVGLVIKTVQARYPELEQLVLRLHPYDTPELIVLPIVNGLPAYLEWISEETKKDLHV